MPRFDVSCAVCSTHREMDIKLADAPKVGERYEVASNTLACSCGCRAFVRVMDKKAPGFKLNFRHTTP